MKPGHSHCNRRSLQLRDLSEACLGPAGLRLRDPGVEGPSDYDGIVEVLYDDAEGRQRKLVTELRAANVPVSQTWWQLRA